MIWLNNNLVLHYIRLKRLAGDKHTSLLGLFISHEKNEGLRVLDWSSSWVGTNNKVSGKLDFKQVETIFGVGGNQPT
jgi:hypothetical protein